jgi:hypothetical protein
MTGKVGAEDGTLTSPAHDNGENPLIIIDFKVASVTEPSTMLVLGMGLVELVGSTGKFTNFLVSIRRWGIRV